MLNWKKLVLYPAAIWAIIYLFICLLIGFKLNASANWVMIVTTLISVAGLYFFASAAEIKDWRKAIILAVIWVLVMLVLDLLLTRPFTGWAYFHSWKTYFSYGLTLVIPILVSFQK